MAEQWGNWKNLGPIDEGGQGHVFKVQDSNGVMGALKRLKNVNRIDRFANEVAAARTIAHPHIASLLDANLDADKPYAVFEFVDGGSLARFSKEALEQTPLDQRLEWAQQVCEAIAFAHEKNVIHRDIKPDNVLIDTSTQSVKLCDFGLVFFLDGERVTATMEQVGSRFYIAPECEDGRAEDITAATDLYSLGKLIYFLASEGKMFAREKHREQSRDLANLLQDPFLEHVSVLLDQLVVGDREKRVKSANVALDLIIAARRRIRMSAPCKGKPETHICLFCREGTYKVAAISQRRIQTSIAARFLLKTSLGVR